MMKRIVLSVCAAVAAAVLARAETTYTWVGGNGNWEDGTKWSSSQGEGVPGAGDHAVLPAPSAAAGNYVVTANEAINVASLTVGSDTVGTDCLATFESKTNGTHQIGAGGLVVKAGGKMTHTVLPTTAKTFAAECYKLNLKVKGDVTIATNGTIDVTSRGFFGTVTLPGSVTANGSHGGTRAVGGCYDSLIAPTNCGSCTVDPSGGTRYSGGGVVRIDAKGAIIVNGSIVSSSKAGTGYGSGAGGSVWLTGADLQGDGMISVQGGDDNYGSAGAGGRLAVWLTKATGFDSWDGEFIAKGGAYQRSPSGFGSGAPGTIYLQAAGGNVKTATVIVDNDKLDQFRAVGYAEICKRTGWKNVGKVVVQNKAYVKLVEDLRIRDLDLATADVKLNVGTNVLTISTTEHKDGKGWADTLDKLVTKEIDLDTGKTGDVVWKPQGIAIIVR